MARTLQQLAQEALDVQDACSLSGVVRSFARALSDLWTVCPEAGTDDINRHPISIVWADKIAHLTGTQALGHDAVTAAYKVVHAIARGGHCAVCGEYDCSSTTCWRQGETL